MILIYRPVSSAAAVASSTVVVLLIAVLILVALGFSPELAVGFTAAAALWASRTAMAVAGSRRRGGVRRPL